MAKNQNAFKSKRLSLRGIKFEDAVRAFMQTPKRDLNKQRTRTSQKLKK
jgi:hypothetical protein